MIKQNFLKPIALMQKFWGKIDDELVEIYWGLFKCIDDILWEDICNEIIKSFIPSNQVPFPVPAHFDKAKEKIIQLNELHKPEPYYLEYKGSPPLTKQEEAESNKRVADFFRELAKEIRKNPNRHVLNNLFDS